MIDLTTLKVVKSIILNINNMAKTEHYYTKFEENNYYHIFNRSVDRKPMFKNDGNYIYFMKQYNKYLSPVVDTYSYCLLGNHFHMLIRVPDKLSNINPEKTVHDIVSHQFRKFFQSYAMAFNKQQNRIGTLFQTPFKRALVDNDQYLTQLVYYIHANPQLHGLINDFRDWNWSSYNKILTDNVSKLKKNELLEWFGGKKEFVNFHSERQILITDERYVLEDEI